MLRLSLFVLGTLAVAAAGFIAGRLSAKVQRPSPPTKRRKDKNIMRFELSVGQAPFRYSFDLTGVTGRDEKGNEFPVTKDDVEITVESDDPEVLQISADDELDGQCSVMGKDGMAVVSAKVEDNDGNVLAAESHTFVVSGHGPIKTISPVGMRFDGVTPVPEEVPPAEAPGEGA